MAEIIVTGADASDADAKTACVVNYEQGHPVCVIGWLGDVCSISAYGVATFDKPSQTWTQVATLAAFSQAIVPVAVVTGATFTAAAGTLVPIDTTTQSCTVTLPSAPPDGTRIALKMVATASGHTVTFNTSGTDVLNKAGGATSGTLTLLQQAWQGLYKASTGIWYVVADDLPLSQLDLRYLGQVPQAASAPTYVKGTLYFDTTLNKLRVGGATAWETVTSV